VPGLGRVLLGLPVATVELGETGQLGVLARELLEPAHVARRVLGREQAVQLLQPFRQAVEPGAQRGVQGRSFSCGCGTAAPASRRAYAAPRRSPRSAPAWAHASACW